MNDPWKRIALASTAAAVCAAPAVAGPRACRTATSVRVVARAERVDAALTIAPFAVPVAVPVATVQQPTLLYAYSTYASAPAVSASAAPSEFAPSEAITAESILRNRCAACHSGPQAKGGLELFDAEGVLHERLRRRAVLDMTAADERGAQRMPPGDREKLDAAELEILRQWAEPPPELEY